MEYRNSPCARHFAEPVPRGSGGLIVTLGVSFSFV